MVKIVVALVAALCACAVVNAVPAFHSAPAAHPHTNLDPADIFKKIEEIIDTVEEKITEVSKKVEAAIEGIIDNALNLALQGADAWNNELQKWADIAAAAGVDVQDCLNQRKAIADVVAEFQADAKLCATANLDEVLKAHENFKAVGPEAMDLLEEAAETFAKCTEASSAFDTAVCVVKNLLPIQIKAGALLAKATVRATFVLGKVAAAGPLVTLCANKVAAAHSAEATTIVSENVACIKAKLDGNHF